jgi:riboflavin biosynthesis pyrimidine reductase
VYDPEGKLTLKHHVFADDGQTVFYFSKHVNHLPAAGHIQQHQLSEEKHAQQILDVLFAAKTGSLLVEGGAFVHNMFIAEKLWDEAWVIRTQHALQEGIRAPVVRGSYIGKYTAGMDSIIGIARERAD